MTEPGGSPPSSRQFRTAEGGAVPVLSAGWNAGRMRGNAGRDFDFDFSKKARKPRWVRSRADTVISSESGGVFEGAPDSDDTTVMYMSALGGGLSPPAIHHQ
jgi:hypothetical protein